MMSPVLWKAVAAAVLLLLPGATVAEAVQLARTAPGAPVGEEKLTYAADIAPIIIKNCVECHRPGQGAPFDFRDPETAIQKAKLIAYVTETGYMPPWKAEDGHVPLKNARGLDDRQIARIQQWVEQGAPAGDLSEVPPLPAFPDGWRLGEPDIVVQMDEGYAVPAEGPDIYRNFVVPLPGIPEGRWLKAVEFRPSAREVVHHSLFALDVERRARALDKLDPEPGFSGMAAGLQDSRIGGYAVGTLPVPFPEGVAIDVPEGSDLVLETHFHPVGKAAVEQSQIGLFLTDEPPTKALVHLNIPVGFGITTGLDIPPGDPDYTVEHTFTIPVDVEATAIMPHAHYLCKAMKSVAKLPDGREKVLVSIRDWDFAWQEKYTFKEPVALPAGTVLHMTFVYDNTADNPFNPHNPPERVTWGPQSTDEMASLALDVIPEDPEAKAALKQHYDAYRMAEIENLDGELVGPILKAQMLQRFDTNQDGDLSFEERMEMLRRMRVRMQTIQRGDSPFAQAMVKRLLKAVASGEVKF